MRSASKLANWNLIDTFVLVLVACGWLLDSVSLPQWQWSAEQSHKYRLAAFFHLKVSSPKHTVAMKISVYLSAIFYALGCISGSSFVLPFGQNNILHHSKTSDRTRVYLSSQGNKLSYPSDHEASTYSFEDMKLMETRLGNLQREAPELLCGFYESHLKSFSVRPGAVTVSCRIRILESIYFISLVCLTFFLH